MVNNNTGSSGPCIVLYTYTTMTNYITTFLSTALLSVVVTSVVPTDRQVDTTCGETTVTPGYTVTLCVQGSPTHSVGAASR